MVASLKIMGMLSLCLSTLLFLVINEVTAEDVYVSNNTYDLHNYTIEFHNESLEMILERVQQGTNVWIDIKIPELLLKGNITFVNLHSVTINGEPGLIAISCTAEHSGIVFNDIADMIRLNNLKFISCGSKITHMFKKSEYISALVLIYCRNMEISRVIVERSKGMN